MQHDTAAGSPPSVRARSKPATVAVSLPWFSPTTVTIGRQAVAGHSYSDTLSTLGRMAQLIRLGADHPEVQRVALKSVSGRPLELDRSARAAAVHGWVRSHIRFVPDAELVASMSRLAGLDLAPDAELLIAPWHMATMSPAAGDCDDFSMLAGAMLAALGVPVELVIIAANGERPTEFSHVYLYAVLEDGRRLAVDASHGPTAGWEAPQAYAREVWPVLELRRGSGLSGLPRGLAAVDPLEQEVLYGKRARVSRPHSSSAGVPARGMGAIDWGSIIQTGVQTGATIAQARYAVPPAGTFIQSAQGTMYRGDPNTVGANLAFPPTSSGMGTWVLLGAGALLLVVMMGRR